MKKFITLAIIAILSMSFVGCSPEKKEPEKEPTRGEKITGGVADILDGILGD